MMIGFASSLYSASLYSFACSSVAITGAYVHSVDVHFRVQRYSVFNSISFNNFTRLSRDCTQPFLLLFSLLGSECSMKLMYTAIDPAAALLLLLAPISFSNRCHSRRAALTVGKTRHYILIGPLPGKSRLGVAGAQ